MPLAISRLKRIIPVGRLILVGPKGIFPRLESQVDVFVGFDEPNVGKARGIGLKHVETESYASIDSDVLISQNWYKWCRKALKPEKVAAAQGFEKNISGIYSSLAEKWIRQGASFKGVRLPAGLGNTLLKTDVVRDVGMPVTAAFEDLELARRIRQAGYLWVCNLNLVSTHLKNDVDVWKHWARWAFLAGDGEMTKIQLKILLYDLSPLHAREKHTLSQEHMFDIAFRISYILGRIHSKLEVCTRRLPGFKNVRSK
ncbi:MAG: glycosyltransferase family 2 protein [Candidatus Bathyarchaeota archaeon]|nr:MAG: glycosyltransferase family 2 protein [Candidatus Bathyarchaeota archaeon]